jgi:hypothetical protein
MKLLKAKSDSSTGTILSLLDRYAGFISLAGKKARRSSFDEGNRLISSLGEDQKVKIISRLQSDVLLFEETLGAKERLTDSPRLLWRYLVKSGLTPCSDIFGKIEETDVLNVYGLDQDLIFQNFSFFDWTSFTLEQIFFEKWYKATQRDPAVTRQVYEAAVKVFSGESKGTVDPEIPWHVVEEVESELLFQFHLRIKYISPLFVNQNIAGLLAVNECRELRSRVEGASF